MYKTELIKAQSASEIKTKVQKWLDKEYDNNSRFTVISVSYTFEDKEGYRAFVTYTD